MSNQPGPMIYLAGPGVFRPDAQAWGQRLQQACAQQGLVGLYPLDQPAPLVALEKAQLRARIFSGNCDLIRKSTAIFADLRAFRSLSEPDSGTAFEVGYAYALGKPIWLWLPDVVSGTAMLDRVAHQREGDVYFDSQGQIIEDFLAPLNLMLWEAASGTSFAAEPEEALSELAGWLRHDT